MAKTKRKASMVTAQVEARGGRLGKRSHSGLSNLAKNFSFYPFGNGNSLKDFK